MAAKKKPVRVRLPPEVTSASLTSTNLGHLPSVELTNFTRIASLGLIHESTTPESRRDERSTHMILRTPYGGV